MGITIKLYQSSYVGYPLFASRLCDFLIDYDLYSLVRFIVLCGLSVIFIVMVSIHKFFLCELAFPAFYLFELSRGEILDSFHRAMMSDIFLRPYFEQEEKTQ